MNERPILFKPEMVQAILDGRKSQTRRTKKKPWQVGDHLWVREPWQYHDWTEDGEPWILYKADNQVLLMPHTEEWAERVEDIWAELSMPDNYQIDNHARDRTWRPSIHMPRWASRLTLEITDVRVERVQDITEADAMAEGADTDPMTLDDIYAMEEGSIERKLAETLGPGKFSARFDFKMIWNSIHSKDGYEWNANPWVWVYTFKRVEP